MQPQSGEGLAVRSSPIISAPAERVALRGARSTLGLAFSLQIFSFLAGLALQVLVLAFCDPALMGRTFQSARFLHQLFFVVALGFPPLLLFQAVNSDLLYRFATGARRENETATNVLIVLLLPLMLLPIVNLFAIPLISMALWLLARRKLLLVNNEEITGLTPLVIVLVFVMTSMFAVLALGEMRATSPYWLVAVNSVFSAYFCDAVLVNCVTKWKRDGRLSPCTRNAFQFSLRTLLVVALAAGLWGLLLVRVF